MPRAKPCRLARSRLMALALQCNSKQSSMLRACRRRVWRQRGHGSWCQLRAAGSRQTTACCEHIQRGRRVSKPRNSFALKHSGLHWKGSVCHRSTQPWLMCRHARSAPTARRGPKPMADMQCSIQALSRRLKAFSRLRNSMTTGCCVRLFHVRILSQGGRANCPPSSHWGEGRLHASKTTAESGPILLATARAASL